MKKIIFLTLLSIFGWTASYAQSNFSVGAHAGIPVGDLKDVSDIEAGVDLSYRYSLMNMVELGALVGYYRFFRKDNFDDLNYGSIAASGRLHLLTSFFAGLDLGYALAMDGNTDGGIFYRPQIGLKFFKAGIVLSYAAISDENLDLGAVTLGLELDL